MENPTLTVAMLIQSLSAFPSNMPVYLEGGDGNSLPWSGQVSRAAEGELSVKAQNGNYAVVLHAA